MSYSTFDAPGSTPGSKSLPTGIRSLKRDNYLITLNAVTANGKSSTYLYRGHLDGSGKWNPFSYPSGIGRTVTVTALYGPNHVRDGIVQVVGNYNTRETSEAHGCLYEGDESGHGKWLTLTPTTETVDCIAHSVSGDLVVGNYISETLPSQAFIYDIKTKKYTTISKPGAISTTAYGIWHNCEDSYTICGGYSNLNNDGLDTGYVIDYDRSTGKFCHGTSYYYNNDATNNIATHFDGIAPLGAGLKDSHAPTKHGYELTGVAITRVGTEVQQNGFIATIERERNCYLSSKAQWTQIAFPGAKTTTGNSIVNGIAIGVYSTGGLGGTTHGFVRIP